MKKKNEVQEGSLIKKTKQLPIVIGNAFIVILLLAVVIFIWFSKTQKKADKENTLYAYKNDYIGNASNDAAILEKLHIGSDIGRYTLELETKKGGNGLLIHFSDTVSKEDEERLNDSMKSASNVLLALINNADYITWDYVVQNSTTEKVSESYTKDDAELYTGKDIKEYGSSKETFGELLSKLEIEEE